MKDWAALRVLRDAIHLFLTQNGCVAQINMNDWDWIDRNRSQLEQVYEIDTLRQFRDAIHLFLTESGYAAELDGNYLAGMVALLGVARIKVSTARGEFIVWPDGQVGEDPTPIADLDDPAYFDRLTEFLGKP